MCRDRIVFDDKIFHLRCLVGFYSAADVSFDVKLIEKFMNREEKLPSICDDASKTFVHIHRIRLCVLEKLVSDARDRVDDCAFVIIFDFEIARALSFAAAYDSLQVTEYSFDAIFRRTHIRRPTVRTPE